MVALASGPGEVGACPDAQTNRSCRGASPGPPSEARTMQPLNPWPHYDVRGSIARNDGSIDTRIVSLEDGRRYVEICRIVDGERVSGVSLRVDELDTQRMYLNECIRVLYGVESEAEVDALRAQRMAGLIPTAKQGKIVTRRRRK